MIELPRNVLVSLHYYERFDLDRLAGLRIIGDSGAFSALSQGAEITTARLAAWAIKWRHRLCWVAALDVIGDAAATRRNWHELVDEHGVRGVPTIHYGENPALMDYYAKRGVDFVGLGGMVARRSEQDRLMRWLVRVFRYARDHHPGMRFHGWGVSSPKLLRVPFYSVDSSGWGAAYRYGRLTLRDPTTGRATTVALDGRGVYEPAVARLLRDHYEVQPQQVARSVAANRTTLILLSARSAAVAETYFRRAHGPISTPTWINGAPAGPLLHLADSSGPTLAALAKAGPGPRLHLATSAADSMLTLAAGPHLHLAEGAGEHLAHLAANNREETL